MDGLKLQAPMKEVEPLRATHIHCGSEHFLWERFMDAEVGGTHREVTESDLDVKNGRGHVTDHDEKKSITRRGNAFVENPVAKPRPEEKMTGYFEPPMPSSRTFLWTETKDQMFPTQSVQIETTKSEQWIIEEVLISYDDLGEGIVSHNSIIKCAFERLEEAMGDCEERHMLNIWIVLRRVGHDVVNVVVALPPPETEAAQEVCDDDPDDSIGCEVVCDAHVTRIVCSEHQLVPEKSQEERATTVPAKVQQP